MKNPKIISWLNQMSEKGFVILLLLGTLFYNVVIGLSGIDMTDEGYLLSAYQQFFSHTESASTTFPLYNTILIGAIWNSAFESIGIIGFRILAAFCITAIVAVVYILCRNLISRWWIVIGLGIVMLSRHYIFVFHYNQASALVALLITLFIYMSLSKNNVWYMLAAGIAFGMGVLFRIPNICLCGLILVLVPYYMHTSDIRMILKFLGMAFLGLFIGLTINIGIIFLFNHNEYCMSAMESTFNLAHSTNSTHNLQKMLIWYYYQIEEILICIAELVLFFYIIQLILQYENNTQIKWCGIGLSLFYMIYFVFNCIRQENDYIFILYSICCVAFFWVILQRKTYDNIQYHYLVTLAILIMFLLPLGSDASIINVGAYCLYLAMPLALGTLWNNIKSCSKIHKIIMMILIVVISLTAAWGTSHLCYRDTGFRLWKTAFVTESDVLTSLTNPSKAEILNNLLKHIKPHKTDETELLAYPSIPMINYLTNTKPFVNNSWVGIMTYEQFKKEMLHGEQNKALPIIVISKAPNLYWFKANKSWKTILDCEDEDGHLSIKEKNFLLNDFIKRHTYAIEYEDEYFQLLIPKQN